MRMKGGAKAALLIAMPCFRVHMKTSKAKLPSTVRNRPYIRNMFQEIAVHVAVLV